ncbi:MAG: toxin-antitoxin system TumE family protein [Nitrospirota bacterium]
MFFTEYLDLRYKIEKLTFSFHYQDKGGRTIFRYDNAAHKPALNYEAHKHTADGIAQAEAPEFKEVIEEIIGLLLMP